MYEWVGLDYAASHVLNKIMLKSVASLWLQSILYLIGHLDEYSPSVLALLPVKIRRWLLLNLPVADICRYELGGEFIYDIDMEEIWRLHSTRMEAGLVQLESHQEGFWKQRYLEQLWDLGMAEPSGYWLQSYLTTSHSASGRQQYGGKGLCQWHTINKGLFAINTGNENEELELSSIYTHSLHCGHMREYNMNLSGITTYSCSKCTAIFHIPKRYVKYAIREYNLISLLTTFYTLCNFKPQSITLSHPNMCKMATPLSQTILARYPNIFTNILDKTQYLKLLPLYFSDTSSTQQQIHNHETVMNCLHSSVRTSLIELNIYLTVSPIEPMALKEPFRQLRFLSISSLRHNILKKSYTNHVIAYHHSTLRVLDIKQCSFRTMLNLSTLTDLFSCRQFSTMSFYKSVFVVNTFQELLFNFIMSNVQGNQILTFKNALLEGNESFRLPIKKEQPSSLIMTKTLDIDDMKAAFYSLNELQTSLKQFPTLYLNRLNLTEMTSLEIMSFLPLIIAREFCLSISRLSSISKSSVDILKRFLNINKFQRVMFCINIDKQISVDHNPAIKKFSKCITAPTIPLKSVKITWLIDQHPNVPSLHQQRNDNKLLFEELLVFIMKFSRLNQLELDISESYNKSPSPIDILYKTWYENSNGMQLAKLVINREECADLSVSAEMAMVVNEISTTCEV